MILDELFLRTQTVRSKTYLKMSRLKLETFIFFSQKAFAPLNSNPYDTQLQLHNKRFAYITFISRLPSDFKCSSEGDDDKLRREKAHRK